MPLIAEPTKSFRITYRREVIIKADNEKQAQEKFDSVDEQTLHDESSYIEQVSIEEIEN
jgi:hypothetical protein